jgi:hypothetical protein
VNTIFRVRKEMGRSADRADRNELINRAVSRASSDLPFSLSVHPEEYTIHPMSTIPPGDI